MALSKITKADDITLSGGVYVGGTGAANYLDDYEEGTFTPTLIGTTTAGTASYSHQNGKYTKIGNVVHFTIYLSYSSHTGTGNINITGLPFTTDAQITIFSLANDNLSFTGNPPFAYATNGTTIDIRSPVNGGASAAIAMDATAALYVNGVYKVT